MEVWPSCFLQKKVIVNFIKKNLFKTVWNRSTKIQQCREGAQLSWGSAASPTLSRCKRCNCVRPRIDWFKPFEL